VGVFNFKENGAVKKKSINSDAILLSGAGVVAVRILCSSFPGFFVE